MPTTLTPQQVAALDIAKTDLRDKHTSNLAVINRAITLAEEISVMEANVATKKAELAALDVDVATESADFANFFLGKAGL